MQLNSATLIYDLNTIEGTVESYLKKQPFKTVQLRAWNIAPSSVSLKKTKTVMINQSATNPLVT